MYSIRKWLYKPKKSDSSMLAQFFYADEELNLVAAELDSFDGRKDPERCSTLVNQLRVCQDKVLHYIENIMDEVIPLRRTSRDFRVKFPDDVLQERLSGQLWFGAECLAAGSSILNREIESTSMRPLAKALTRHLDYLRSVMRDQCLRNVATYSDRIKEALVLFDRLFADFELSYVSAMVPVKTMKEYDMLQDLTVLFCETVRRALRLKLLTQDMIDDYDPALMFTIPRLAIVCGLLVFPEGPLNPDQDAGNISEMFRPFQTLLFKIRELLWTLSKEELWALENSLSIAEEPSSFSELEPVPYESIEDSTKIMAESLPAGGAAACCEVDTEENAFCRMVTSPSTDTVVASPGCHSNSSSAHLSTDGANGCMHHQDSSDSGMLSDHSQPTSPSELKAACSTAASHKGAPAAGISNSSDSFDYDRQSATQRQMDCNGNPADFENLENVEGHTSLVRSRHPSEFSFNLPLNTSADWSETQQNEASPVIMTTNADSTAPPVPRIIYTSDSPEQMEEGQQQQISFVTETLNEVFVTDSSFQVLSSEGSTISRDLCGASAENTDLCDSTTSADQGDENVNTTNELNISTNTSVSRMEEDISATSTQQNEEEITQIDMDTSYFREDDSVNEISQESTSSKIKSKSDFTDSLEVQSSNKSTGSDFPVGKRATRDGDAHSTSSDCLDVPPRVQRVRYTESVSSSCTSCHSASSECDWDRESYASSETSSYTSECKDDEEIALAIQAAENAARKEARARFHSSSDLIHRLYVCISGVADQLQTNYASELRHILKCVFECTASEEFISLDAAVDEAEDVAHQMTSEETEGNGLTAGHRSARSRSNQEPPLWVPDDQCPHCTSCKVPFTFVRRRHHCRNCGKIFCGRCSSNTATLPQYGHTKPVRVCNSCVMFHVNPFTVDE